MLRLECSGAKHLAVCSIISTSRRPFGRSLPIQVCGSHVLLMQAFHLFPLHVESGAGDFILPWPGTC